MDSTTGSYKCDICGDAVPIGMSCKRCIAGVAPPPDKDQTIADLRKRLEEAERERDSLKIVGEEISKQCTILNNKLARYREGFEQIKVALKGEGANDGDDVITAVREAIKAVEGLTL